MKIVIKTKNLKLTPALKSFIEEKINDLEKFCFFGSPSQILKNKTWEGKGKPRIEAWVEIGKTTRHHQKGLIFWAECQMRFPKKSLRSTATRESLKLAITEVKDELQRELKQYKEKSQSRAKRGARILKKDLKISPAARFYRKGRIREEGI